MNQLSKAVKLPKKTIITSSAHHHHHFNCITIIVITSLHHCIIASSSSHHQHVIVASALWTLDDCRGMLSADSPRCSLQSGRYDCSPLSQVCDLKGNQGCGRHLCWENPETPLWHRKHQADVAGSPNADGLQVQAGGQQRWCSSSRQAQQLLYALRH